MNNFYSQLMSGTGSKKVKYDGTVVNTESYKDKVITSVKSTYTFIGETNIAKETMSLLDQTRKRAKLKKVEIIRTTHPKDVTIAVRFLSEDDVLIYNEADVQLLSLSDHVLMERLGIEVNR